MSQSPRRFVALAVLLALFSLFGLAADVQLTVLHLNDTHGYLSSLEDRKVAPGQMRGGAAYWGDLIQRERAKNPEGTLLLSAGDMYQGTPVSNVFRGKPMVEVMNVLGFDAQALGNHEFDWGLQTLSELQAMARFPYLAANVTGPDGKAPAQTRPWVMLVRKGVKIAVIGLSAPETAYTTRPDNVRGFVFAEPARVLPPLLKKVRAEGARVVIVLSHLGVDADRRLAQEVPGVDLIVGGHSHTALLAPEKVGGTWITQAGYNGIWLGVTRLLVDTKRKTGIQLAPRSGLMDVNAGPGIPSDAHVARIVDGYAEKIKPEFARVVGESEVDLLQSSRGESSMGNLVTDSMREASGADIAIQNSGGIRAGIARGPITMEKVFSVLPFDNLLVTVELTGAQIREIAEKAVAEGGRILQVSGMRVVYRREGERMTLREISAGGSPLDPSKTYRVATNDFLVMGGDNLKTFQQGKVLVYGGTLRDVLVDYLKKHSPVRNGLEGRIVVE